MIDILKRIFLCGMFAILLSGCVGIDIVHVNIEEVVVPKVNIHSNISEEYFGKNRNDGFRWRGLIVTAILPIPLVVPMGNEEIFEVRRDEEFVYFQREITEANGFFCLLVFYCSAEDTMGDMFFDDSVTFNIH